MTFHIEYQLPGDEEIYRVAIQAEDDEDALNKFYKLHPEGEFIEITGDIIFNIGWKDY